MYQRNVSLVAACLFLLLVTSGAFAQGVSNAPAWIPSLTEPGQGLTVRGVSPQTGRATFASSDGAGILLQVEPNASAAERALAFVETYGREFGLSRKEDVRLTRSHVDDLGVEHVRLQQVHRGVPVTGGEFFVHLKGQRVKAANGRTVADPPDDVMPTIQSERARGLAREMIRKRRLDDGERASYSEPRLEILNRAFLTGTGTDRSRLAWFVEASAIDLRQYIWIDAQTGGILLTFSQLADAKNRVVYSANNTPSLPGTLVRSEGGGATGDADNDNAYLFAGITYDYFYSNFGRDSYDGLGAQIISTTHYCPADTCPGDYGNAFWNGTQMVYGNGYASADDVVGHELAHAVTEKTAGLFYYYQSGALNESFSDIFGEAIDLSSSAGTGNDTAGARWYMGEDLLIGAIRNMMNPNLYQNPAKMSDPLFWCVTSGWTDPNGDRGGVHINSGVPNHAFALMVDGGSYNGKTISPIGLTKAAKIQYRALSTYLLSGSNFIDNYFAVKQSCSDLIGTAGITASDCTQVQNALEAVEMHLPFGCAGATQAPPLCTTGTPQFAFFDGFEAGLLDYTATVNNQDGFWMGDQGVAKGGTRMAYGSAPASSSTHILTMLNPVVIPAGGKMYFDHLFEFENSDLNYDGGRFEYSVNNGVTWFDANSLVEAGHAYDGMLDSGNPIGGGMAFVGASYGYVGTRLNLAALAGQSIRFRFKIGTDAFVGSLGWLLDNLSIYACVTQPQHPPFTDDPLVVGQTAIKAVHITELRSRINAIRIAKGLRSKTWANAVAAGAGISAADIGELRIALIEAYNAAALPLPVFTDSIVSGAPVKALHISQLRTAVLDIE